MVVTKPVYSHYTLRPYHRDFVRSLSASYRPFRWRFSESKALTFLLAIQISKTWTERKTSLTVASSTIGNWTAWFVDSSFPKGFRVLAYLMLSSIQYSAAPSELKSQSLGLVLPWHETCSSTSGCLNSWRNTSFQCTIARGTFRAQLPFYFYKCSLIWGTI